MERLRDAGAEISLALDGDLERLPATTGATVYRIVQEALTNASQARAGAAVTVRSSTGAMHVELIVDSAGAPGHGHGMGVSSDARTSRGAWAAAAKPVRARSGGASVPACRRLRRPGRAVCER